MSNIQNIAAAYGLTQPILNVPFPPIVATRNPLITDKASYGTIWINKVNGNTYILNLIGMGGFTWTLIEGSGGPADFTSLTVNPGPTNLTGTTNITGSTTIIGTTLINSTGTSATTIGNAAGTVNIDGSDVIINNTGNQDTTIGAFTSGVISIGQNATSTIQIGSSSADAIIQINSGGAGGISMNSLGTGSTTIGSNTGLTQIGGPSASGVNINIGGGGLTRVGGTQVNVGDTTSTINIGGTNNDVNINSNSGSTGDTAIGCIGGGNVFIAALGSTADVAICDIGTGALTMGNPTGEVTINSILNLPGPIRIITGSGTPSNGLAIQAGDLYINTNPTTANNRLFIATGAGAWTFFAANA